MDNVSVRSLCLAGLLTLTLGGPVSAQTVVVRGTVTEEGSGRPLLGARVSLLVGESTLTSVVVDSIGGFELLARRLPVRLLIAALGSESYDLSIEEPGEHDLGRLPLAPSPLSLDGISVAGQSRCDATPEELRVGAALLAAVRPQLEAIHENDNATGSSYVLDVVRSEREVWDDGRLRYSRDTVRVRAPAALRGSAPQDILERGFAVAVNDSVNEYRAFTAEWLASTEFAESYCLAASGSEVEGQLRFWPKPDQQLVGGVGTMQIVSGQVLAVEYEFANLKPFVELHEVPWLEQYWRVRRGVMRVPTRPLQFNRSEHGGALHFQEVAEGTWMTVSWRVDGVRLAARAEFERGEFKALWPRTVGWERSARLLAVVPVTSR